MPHTFGSRDDSQIVSRHAEYLGADVDGVIDDLLLLPKFHILIINVAFRRFATRAQILLDNDEELEKTRNEDGIHRDAPNDGNEDVGR